MAGGMQIASLFATIGADTSGLQKGLGGAKTSLEGLGSSMAKQVIGTVSLMGALAAVGKFVQSSVTDWVDYADSMRLSAQMAGVTTEEMSRLAQAADDFRVPIETMQKSMELALKNGFVPTIENLATLSDELLAIEDPALRAEAASKIFGKSYADMMPFLLAGGDAIRGATGSIADNLIVTADAAAKAKEYKDALDELGDTWTGVKNVLGQAIAPVAIAGMKAITAEIGNTVKIIKLLGLADEALSAGKINLGEYLEMVNNTMGDTRLPEWQEEVNGHILDMGLALNKTTPEVAAYRTEQQKVGDEMFSSSSTWQVYRDKVVASGQAMDLMSEATFNTRKELEGVEDATLLAGEVAKQAAEEWKAYVAAVGEVTSLTASFNSIIGLATEYDDILGEIAANAEERDRLMAAGFSETSDAVVALDDATAGLKQSMTDLANQMTLDMFQATIAIDGIVESEAGAYFQMAADMGIISQEAADAAMLAYGNAVKTINGMTLDEKTLTVKTKIDTTAVDFYTPDDKWAYVHYGTTVTPMAAGGPISGGAPYLVGERGPELFVPESSGNIIPNGRTSSAINSGGDITQSFVMEQILAALRAMPDNIGKSVRDNILLAS